MGDILAGTQSNGELLRSTNNGLTFPSLGDQGYGNITCMTRLVYSNHIVYGTSTGNLVDFTTGELLATVAEPITAIIGHYYDLENDIVLIGTNNGKTYIYYYLDQSCSLYTTVPGGYQINAYLAEGSAFCAMTSNGVYVGADTLVQEGDFRSALKVSSSSFYIGDASGHVWKSTGNFYTWNDLGMLEGGSGLPIYAIIINAGVKLFGTNNAVISLTGDDPTQGIRGDIFGSTSQNVISLTAVIGNIIIAGASYGEIFRSTDNGLDWDMVMEHIAGIDEINALIMDETASTTTISPTTTQLLTTTIAPLVRGVVISHQFPTRVTSEDLVPHVVFVVNPGISDCYEFIDMFISASYKPTSVLLATDKNFTDPATVVASHIKAYNSGWYHISTLPRTAGNKVLIGKLLFVKVSFDNQDLFYDLKLVKTGYKAVAGG